MNLLKKKWFLILTIFSFLKPAGFDRYGLSSINIIINYSRIAFALIIIIMYLFYYKKLSKFVVCELIYFGCLFFSSLVNDSDISMFINKFVSIFCFTLLFEMLVQRNSKVLIDALYLNYCILILGNFALMIFNYGFSIGTDNNLINTYSFLSSDNMTASYIFPAIIISGLYSGYRGKTLTFSAILLNICIFLTEIMMWSATSLAGLFIAMMYILLIFKRKIEKIINFKVLLAIAIAMIIGITIFKIQYLFSFIIENILHKELTLTGRTNIWNMALIKFSEAPILGFGNDAITIDNGLLQVLYRGGIISLIAIIILFFNACSPILRKYKNNSNAILMSFMLIIVLFMSISESWFYFFGFFVILCISYYIFKIDEQQKMQCARLTLRKRRQ